MTIKTGSFCHLHKTQALDIACMFLERSSKGLLNPILKKSWTRRHNTTTLKVLTLSSLMFCSKASVSYIFGHTTADTDTTRYYPFASCCVPSYLLRFLNLISVHLSHNNQLFEASFRTSSDNHPTVHF